MVDQERKSCHFCFKAVLDFDCKSSVRQKRRVKSTYVKTDLSWQFRTITSNN